MDLVETGVVAFVAFVFIGGSMAYFAGPPALEEFSPDLGPAHAPCGDECRNELAQEADEKANQERIERDDDDDDRDKDRGGKGHKRGKG